MKTAQNNSIKRGRVFVGDQFAGIIEERDGRFSFQYDFTYLKNDKATAVSLSLPLRAEAYIEKTMIPFFDGLIPEGWLLNILTENWKVNTKDRMALLLLSCRDTIGNVSVVDEASILDGQSDVGH